MPSRVISVIISLALFQCVASSGRWTSADLRSVDITNAYTQIEDVTRAIEKHHHQPECDKGHWRKRVLKLIDEAPAAGESQRVSKPGYPAWSVS